MPGSSTSNISEFFGSGRQSRISMLAEGRLQEREAVGLCRSRLPLRRRDFQQQPEQQLHAPPTAGVGPGRVRQRLEHYRRTDVESGHRNQAWRGQSHRSVAHDHRSAVYRRLQLGTAIRSAPGEELRQQGLVRGCSGKRRRRPSPRHNNAANFLVGSAGAALQRRSACYVTTCSAQLTRSIPRPTSSRSWRSSRALDTTRFSACTAASAIASFPAKTYLRPLSAAAAPRPDPTLRARSTVQRTAAASAPMLAGRLPTSTSTSDCMALGGSGVGRYGTGGLSDVSVHANGTLDLIKSLQGLATLEWHGPKLDVYLNAGAEYASRAADYDPVTKKVCRLRIAVLQQYGLLHRNRPGSGRIPAGRALELHRRHARADRRHGGCLVQVVSTDRRKS